MAATDCHAQGLSLQVSTGYENNKIIYGCTATYKVMGNPPQGTSITGVEWRYTQTGPNCTSTPTNWAQGGYERSYTETLVGNYKVEARVSYRAHQTYQNPNPPTNSTIIEVDVSVPPPDGISLPAQLPIVMVRNMQGQQALFNFPITCQGVNICNGAGIEQVKENISNQIFFEDEKEDLEDHGEPHLLYLMGTSIMDVKSYNFIPVLPNQPAVFHTYDQQLVLKVRDRCGNLISCPLGPVLKVQAKAFLDNGVWKVEISVDANQ